MLTLVSLGQTLCMVSARGYPLFSATYGATCVTKLASIQLYAAGTFLKKACFIQVLACLVYSCVTRASCCCDAEWFFRSSLDRYVWIYGMICAFIHPWYSGVLAAIENMPVVKRNVVRSIILSVCAVVGYFWYVHVYTLPKVEYNKVSAQKCCCQQLSPGQSYPHNCALYGLVLLDWKISEEADASSHAAYRHTDLS